MKIILFLCTGVNGKSATKFASICFTATAKFGLDLLHAAEALYQ